MFQYLKKEIKRFLINKIWPVNALGFLWDQHINITIHLDKIVLVNVKPFSFKLILTLRSFIILLFCGLCQALLMLI